MTTASIYGIFYIVTSGHIVEHNTFNRLLLQLSVRHSFLQEYFPCIVISLILCFIRVVFITVSERIPFLSSHVIALFDLLLHIFRSDTRPKVMVAKSISHRDILQLQRVYEVFPYIPVFQICRVVKQVARHDKKFGTVAQSVYFIYHINLIAGIAIFFASVVIISHNADTAFRGSEHFKAVAASLIFHFLTAKCIQTSSISYQNDTIVYTSRIIIGPISCTISSIVQIEFL